MWCRRRWRSVRLIVWEMEYCIGSRRRGIIVHTTKGRKAIWIGHILRRCLLKHVIEGKLEGGIEVRGRQGGRLSSYWMTFKKREDTGN